VKKGKFKCWGIKQDIAVLLHDLTCDSVCSTVDFRASGKGKAERRGWKLLL